MRLADLNPRFYARQRGRGVLDFDCPVCGKRGCRVGASTTSGEPFAEGGVNYHRMIGTPPNWDDITISPSIDMRSGCHWHGHVTNGEVTP